MIASDVERVAETIQLAVAPVFLLAGIGGFLNVCTGRLARIIDRVRTLEEKIVTDDGPQHDRQVAELNLLSRRMRVVNGSIALTVGSAVAVSLVVMALFAGELSNLDLGDGIAVAFIVAMLLLSLGFATFLHEVRLAARSIRVRRSLLNHERGDGDPDDGERGHGPG